MSRGKQLRAGGTGGAARPTQGLRDSIYQHTRSPSVAYQYVHTYHRAYQGGSSEVKDIYGPFGHSRTTFEAKFTGT